MTAPPSRRFHAAPGVVAIAVIATGILGELEVGIRAVPDSVRDLPYDGTADLVSMALAGSSILSALVLAVRDWVRMKSALPLLLVLSGPAGAFAGAVVDALGGAYMVDGPHLPTFVILGREMGTFIFAAWSGFGIFLYWIFSVLTANPKTKLLWWLLAGACVIEIGSEEGLLARGAYAYFGNQPLVLVNLLPWWFVVCNIVGCFLAAALAFRYRGALTGWRGVWMIAVTPLSVLATYAAIGLPSIIAVNSTYPWLPTQALGLTTIIGGVVASAVILGRVLARRPLDGSSRAALRSADAQP